MIVKKFGSILKKMDEQAMHTFFSRNFPKNLLTFQRKRHK